MLNKAQVSNVSKLFDVYDLDGNGVIEWVDFARVVDGIIDGLNQGPFSPWPVRMLRAYRRWWNAIRDVADGNSDGGVTRAEFLLAAETGLLRDSEFMNAFLDAAETVFDAADADDDGMLALSEVLGLCQSAGFEDDELIGTVFYRLDRDHDGRISLAEWQAAARAIYTADTPHLVG
ncbi:hypothetical protein D5S17_12050 [Pseudonocardiaceae bacterium YIM PH 21723]|nr:hypothetical protein D5S17_12050 [Pseudonocardiaceae bacterium YIM PH 21723]